MLVIGGCRSGKSGFAERWVRESYTKKTYVATLEAKGDNEMLRRIELHRMTRDNNWHTVEEPLDIVGILQGNPHSTEVFLVDCLTMWITNGLMNGMDDADIEEEVHRLRQTVEQLDVSVVLVANEVGLGIVPESTLGRRFRDLAGWTNQQMALSCNEVVFVAAGLPMQLKGRLFKHKDR